MTRRTWLALAPLALAITPRRAAALAFEMFGNEPLVGGVVGVGADGLPLVNLPTRVYLHAGSGGSQFFFRGDAAAANEALRLFGRLDRTDRRVVLAAGPGEWTTFQRKRVPFDFWLDAPARFVRPNDTPMAVRIQVTAATAPPADVTPFLGGLDSPRFTARDAATRELAKLGRSAKPGLLAARASTPSAEVRGRIDALLAKLTGTDVNDLVIPDGLPVVAADENAKSAATAIRDDIARLVASRTRPEARK